MKILISLTYYLPNISGVSIYADVLAKDLAKKDQVTILTSKFKNNLLTQEKIGKIYIRRIWSPLKINKGILMPTFPLASLKEVLKTDLVICHLPQLEAVWLALWGKIFRKPIVLVHHCEFGNAPGITKKLIKFLTYFPHYLVYHWADKIVAYTKDYAQHSMFLSKFLTKTEFILPPIILGKKSNKEIKKIAKTIDKKRETKIIGFVGRIGWEKGIDLILKTIPKLKNTFRDFKIVFIGPYKQVIGDKTYQRLKKLFKKYQKWVVLTGPISHEKLVNYYYNFDCLVLPSTNNLETFGIVQPEAMLCGCPVVASNLPGVRTPVGLTSMGKIIPVGNHRRLTKAIIEVIKEKGHFAKKLPLTKKLFDQKLFSIEWDKIVQETLLD